MQLAPPRLPESKPALIDIQAVADLLECSTKHVARMSGDGRMPSGLKLGRLRKWPRTVVEEWIAAGCPRVASHPATN